MTHDDLIARLRDTACQGVELAIKNGRYVSPHEAADAIERLEADNARLREELVQIEVDAMEHYNDWMEHGCEPVEATRFAFDLGQYTRAALQETSHD